MAFKMPNTSYHTFNDSNKFKIATTDLMTVALIMEIEVPLSLVFLPTPHLNPYLIHVPDMLRGNTPQVLPIQPLPFIQVIIDNHFVEVLCSFWIKLCRSSSNKLRMALLGSTMPVLT